MVGEVRVWVRVAGQEMASSLPTGEVTSPAVRGGARGCAGVCTRLAAEARVDGHDQHVVDLVEVRARVREGYG